MDDDITIRGINRGPGWWSVLFISLLMCLGVVSGFYAGLVQGWIPMPARFEPEPATKPEVVKAPETPRVPILVGLPVATADELLKGRGLRLAIKERRPDDLLDAESVISQDPA